MTKATKEEREYMTRVANLGCIVCSEHLGIYDSPSCVHHITTNTGMGKRSSHKKVLPLCHAHHQGGGYGVAIHAGQKEWESRYGTQQELLEIVNSRL